MDLKRKNIIHLDDHFIYTEAVVKSIDPEQKNYSFRSFQHPDDALNYINTCLKSGIKVDLILSDINQYQNSGLDFAASVKVLADRLGIIIPVIILSMKVPAPLNHQNKEEFLSIKGELETTNKNYAGLFQRFLECLEKGSVHSFLGKNEDSSTIEAEMKRLMNST